MTLTLQTLKIPVADLARSVRFYETGLGLHPIFQSERYGWAQLDGAAIPIALYVPGLGGGDRAPGGTVDFQLVTEAPEALLDRLRPLTADAALFPNDDGSRSLEFTDPDGNRLKIMAAAQL